MHPLITLVCAVAGVSFLVGGVASFVVPPASVPSQGTSVVLGCVLLVFANWAWRARRRSGGGDANRTRRNIDVTELLPDIEEFRRVTQSLAALDALMSPEWQFRYYSFDPNWSEEHQLASMRNGSGDEWCARIGGDGIVVRGLLHESGDFVPGEPKPWVFGRLPRELGAGFLAEPSFDTANSTFCLWRHVADSRWSRGPVPASAADDGAHDLLRLLWSGAVGYRDWAEEYYDTRLELADVESFYRHEPVTLERARRMNPDVDFAALLEELAKIGYPSGRA